MKSGFIVTHLPQLVSVSVPSLRPLQHLLSIVYVVQAVVFWNVAMDNLNGQRIGPFHCSANLSNRNSLFLFSHNLLFLVEWDRSAFSRQRQAIGPIGLVEKQVGERLGCLA